MLFGRRLAIYLPGQCVSLGGLAAAAKNRVPLTEVLNDGITTMEDSPTRRDSLFGTIGSIVVTSALQVD
jgi:Ni,Fe-hydrogenase I small subunit